MTKTFQIPVGGILGICDVIAMVVFFIDVATLVAFDLWPANLPGKIAGERGQSQADAINVACWLGHQGKEVFTTNHSPACRLALLVRRPR